MSEQQVEAILKQLVERAVGPRMWVGVQELEDSTTSLLLFNSPTTGSTLAVKFNPKNIHQDRLIAEMQQRRAFSDAEFAKKGKVE
jgi:hypothetical protein